MAKRPLKKTRDEADLVALENDIDERMSDLMGRLAERWATETDEDPMEIHEFVAYMRAAYGNGYTDCLTETPTGSLCVQHGYTIPERVLPT